MFYISVKIHNDLKYVQLYMLRRTKETDLFPFFCKNCGYSENILFFSKNQSLSQTFWAKRFQTISCQRKR